MTGRRGRARTGESRFLAALGMTARKAKASANATAKAKANTGILRFAVG
jgi:hypothetical protein